MEIFYAPHMPVVGRVQMEVSGMTAWLRVYNADGALLSLQAMPLEVEPEPPIMRPHGVRPFG
jgi:hypothetical protein